jgi:hypothetical protein
VLVVICSALLGEPRLLTMCPDALRIDLNDPQVRHRASRPAVGACAGCRPSLRLLSDACTPDGAQTSPDVAALARALIAKDGKTETDTCAVLCVVPCCAPEPRGGLNPRL